MQQALHIFKKDVRRLRYEIIVTLVLAATFASSVGEGNPVFDWQTDRLNRVAYLLRVLLLLSWGYLVARTIQGEPLPGDRQFWVTRPYRWRSLLGAKALFIAVFVILPLLLSDCVILALNGLHPSDHLAGLAWHPLVFCVVFLVPVAALACITARTAEMVLAVVSVVATAEVLGRLSIGPSPPFFASLAWIRISLAFLVLFFGGLTIMILQYHARRTGVSRIFAAATLGLAFLVIAFLPWKADFAFQSWLVNAPVDTSSISIQLQPVERPLPRSSTYANGRILVSLPIDFSNVPLGTLPVVDGIAVELVLPDGKPYKPLTEHGTSTVNGKRRYLVSVEPRLYAQIKNTPLRMRVMVLLTLYGNLHTERMRIDGNSHSVPGVGVCAAEALEKSIRVGCLEPFRILGTGARVENTTAGDIVGADPLSPYPADFGISPMDQVSWQLYNEAGATTIIFTTMQPLAHVRRDLENPNVQLADFAN